MGFGFYRSWGSMWASWYSWSTELCSLHPSKPSVAVCSSAALRKSEDGFPDGRPSASAGCSAMPLGISHSLCPRDGGVPWELASVCNKNKSQSARGFTLVVFFVFFNESSPSGAAHWRFDWPRQSSLSCAAMCWTSDRPERTNVCFSATSLTHSFKAPKTIHFHADGNPSLPLFT